MAITTVTRDGTDQTTELNTALATSNDVRLAGGIIEVTALVTMGTSPKLYSEDGSSIFWRANSDLTTSFSLTKDGASVIDVTMDFNGLNQDSSGDPDRNGLVWSGDNGTCTDCSLYAAGDQSAGTDSDKSNIVVSGDNFTCTGLTSVGAGYAAIQNNSNNATYSGCTLVNFGYKGFNQGHPGSSPAYAKFANSTCSTTHSTANVVQLDASQNNGIELIRGVVEDITIGNCPALTSLTKYANVWNLQVRNVTMDKDLYTAALATGNGIIFAENVGRASIRNCQLPGRVTQFPFPARDSTDHDVTTASHIESLAIDDCEFGSAASPIGNISVDHVEVIRGAYRRTTFHVTSGGGTERIFTMSSDELRFLSWACRDCTFNLYHAVSDPVFNLMTREAASSSTAHNGQLAYPGDYDLRFINRNNTINAVNTGSWQYSNLSDLSDDLQEI